MKHIDVTPQPEKMDDRPSVYEKSPQGIVNPKKPVSPTAPDFIFNAQSGRYGMKTINGNVPDPVRPEDPKKTAAPERGPVHGDFAELRQMDSAIVNQVIDPLHILLRDGRIVQLTGIDVPDFDPLEAGEISAQGRERLEKMLKDKQVRLYQTKDQNAGRVNRMGHHLAHVILVEGDIWLQGDLLAEGLARVRPSQRNPEMAEQMVALEDKARESGRGLWEKKGQYAILTPETASHAINDWAIVEGEIHSTALVNNVLYLNFGPDWRTDFTIGLTSNIRRQLQNAGTDAQNLAGRTVRVRGWIEDYNGPYLELIHPIWLEILESGESPDSIEPSTGDEAAEETTSP